MTVSPTARRCGKIGRWRCGVARLAWNGGRRDRGGKTKCAQTSVAALRALHAGRKNALLCPCVFGVLSWRLTAAATHCSQRRGWAAGARWLWGASDPGVPGETLPLLCVHTSLPGEDNVSALCVPMLSCLRQRLCLVFALPSWLRYCLSSRDSRGSATPSRRLARAASRRLRWRHGTRPTRSIRPLRSARSVCSPAAATKTACLSTSMRRRMHCPRRQAAR